MLGTDFRCNGNGRLVEEWASERRISVWMSIRIVRESRV